MMRQREIEAMRRAVIATYSAMIGEPKVIPRPAPVVSSSVPRARRITDGATLARAAVRVIL